MAEPTPTGAAVPRPEAEIPPGSMAAAPGTARSPSSAGSAAPAIGGALDLATGLARLFGRLPRV